MMGQENTHIYSLPHGVLSRIDYWLISHQGVTWVTDVAYLPSTLSDHSLILLTRTLVFYTALALLEATLRVTTGRHV